MNSKSKLKKSTSVNSNKSIKGTTQENSAIKTMKEIPEEKNANPKTVKWSSTVTDKAEKGATQEDTVIKSTPRTSTKEQPG